MRETIYCVLLLLLLLGIACCVEAPRGSDQLAGQSGQTSIDDWRRTAQGWERATHWEGTTSLAIQPTRIHPVIVLALQLLLSLFALIAFSPDAGGSSKAPQRIFECACAATAPSLAPLVEVHRPSAPEKICHFCTKRSSASHYFNG